MLDLSLKGSTIEGDNDRYNQYFNWIGNIGDFPITFYIPETHSLINYLRAGGRTIRLRLHDTDHRYKDFSIVRQSILNDVLITKETPHGTVRVELEIKPL